MLNVIKEAVLSGLTEWIVSENDHTLRVSRIRMVRIILDKLEVESDRTIKPIDFPLYFFDKNIYQYAACGYSDNSWFLIREDVDPEILSWASSCCSTTSWAEGGRYVKPEKPHPLYPGFGELVEIGNKVSPTKRYYKSSHLRYSPDSIRDGLRLRLGDRCWTKSTLPKDVKGETIYR